MQSKKNLILVILISLIISIALGASLWDMNFWPTDTEVYYMPAALKLPSLHYVSEIHKSFDKEAIRWLHGKEIYILTAAVLQKLMNDTTTLRPFVLICLIAVFLSSILIFLLARDYWGEKPAWIAYFLFITSFWSYFYILMGKHQPLGLFYGLLAIYFLNLIRVEKFRFLFYLLSGISLGSAIYSSNVSPLYIPYFAGAFFFLHRKLKDIVKASAVILIGAAVIFIFVNYPNVIYNVKAYLEYIKISSDNNHFFYNQRVLAEWIHSDIPNTRGGWLWIIKYFQLIMPVMFPLSVVSIIYLLAKCFREKKYTLSSFLIILVGLSSPILADFKRVAQYGANYFTSLPGVILIITYAAYIFIRDDYETLKRLGYGKIIKYAVIIIFAAQFIVNFFIFTNDVYPTRLATTILSEKINDLGIKEIYTYKDNPHSSVIIGELNSELKKKIKFVPINSIFEVKEGFILVPPITTDSIYKAAHGNYTLFDKDIFLNTLVRKDNLKDYAVFSPKTLVSSRIWPNEEEILSYRYLILNQFSSRQVELGRAWLLDAVKLSADKMKNMPSKEDIFLLKNNIENIGAKTRMYMYKGYLNFTKQAVELKKFTARIFKVGDCNDSLRAYLFKIDDKNPVWVPYGADYISNPVFAASITKDSRGSLVEFEFPVSIHHKIGPFYVVIYRTGESSDKDFYRIYSQFQKM